MLSRLTPAFLPALLVSAVLAGQSADTSNLVRESATFLTTGGIAEGNNPINIFATEGGDSVTGIPFDEFIEIFNTARAEGRGGVIDFDNPVYGDPILDYDRTGVRAFIQAQVRGQSFDSQAEAQAAIEAARSLAYDSGVVDRSARGPVINRLDPSLDDPSPGAPGEDILFDKTIGLFGHAGERRLVLRRGPQHYMEGDLASREAPASENLQTVNDNYFTHVARSTYGDGGRPGPLPVSLPFSRNGGMTDLLIDPRDNVTAVGFVLLSAGNFQYWQGLGALPDNTENKRVLVEFSDGSTDLLTSTTLDSSGGGDTFFGIRAPEGTSIVRLKMRVIGRNWRTRTFLDDFAFVTEPSAPFIASAPEVRGSAGAPFYHRLLTAQEPEEVTLEGLPAGLAFDADTGLISGIPAETGDYAVAVTLTNEVGTTEEVIDFHIGPSVDGEQVPRILSVPEIAVTVGRELAPAPVVTSLDDAVLPGELNYFTLVFRLGDDGTRTLLPLEATGLGIAAGVFSGTPDQPAQVGTYEIEVFVTNDHGGDRAATLLNIFPVVPGPNFAGDEATDLMWRDNASGRVYTLNAQGNFLDAEGAFGMRPQWVPRDAGLTVETSTFLGTGDLDGNNHTDIVARTPGTGHIDFRYFHAGDTAAQTHRVDELSGGWEVLMAGDMRGDGHLSFLWHRPATHDYDIWHMVDRDLRWSGILFADGIAREFVLDGDFDGDGTRDLLFRRSPGVYELVNIRILTGTGLVDYTSETFSMPSPDWKPHMAADLTGNGADDLLWKNHYSGEVTAWIMSGAVVPADARASAGENNDSDAPADALPGITVLPFGTRFEVLAALDVDEDQRNDLILQHRETRTLHLMLMDGPAPKAPLITLDIDGEHLEIVAAGDYNADKREDLLVRNTATGEVRFKLMGPSGVAESHKLGVFGDNIKFITPRILSSNLTPPTGRDAPVPPWTQATPLGDRFFHLEGFGTFYDPPGGGWIYHEDHGIIGVAGDSPESIWLIDYALGWFWTNTSIYPWMYYPNPIQTTWIYYARGTKNPRWLYFHAFAEWITDEELLEFL
ncbi:MAG: putative Ig domain-containing protein [Opitutales bacterium]|nr:putative Ig domain-containing protein [Opitutales bacterium]